MKKNVFYTVLVMLITMCVFTNSMAQIDSIPESRRLEVHKRIDEINEILSQKNLRWRAGITSISYLTEEEFRQLCGEIFDVTQVESELVKQDSLYQIYKKEKGLRKIISIPDWQSLMNDIENQGACGNCWAHATSGVVEGLFHHYKGYNFGLDLDEMDISHGCSGGTPEEGFGNVKYDKVRPEQGINSFPNYDHAYYTISDYDVDYSISISDIQSKLQSSPVYASFYVYSDFQHYPGGIYEWDGVSPLMGSHGVVIVGYNDNDDYWVCKNSWGTSWGDSLNPGYFNIAFGECGIDSRRAGTAFIGNDSCYAKLVPEADGLMTLLDAVDYWFVDDEWIYGVNDINISSANTVNIPSEKTIAFESGKKLTVNGTLNAQGTSNNPVVFTRDDPYSTDKQHWQGIIINSGGSYTFNYVEMYGAYYGIKPNYTSGTISNSHFEQNYIGAYLYHANNTNIHNCEFIDNQYGTMASYSSNLNFQNNSYDSNDYYGIYFNRSTGTFKNNVIENNSIHGFYINNQCDVDMNTWLEYGEDPTINNTIQNNASDGMWIGDGDIDLGTYLNIGTDFRGGFNYFNHGSGYLDIRYRGDDDMKAEANWWENMAIDWDFGEIDTDPTANDLGYSLPKSVNGSDSDYTDDLLNQAYYLEKVDSNYVEAIDILNKAADIAPDDPIVQKIVLRLKRLYTKLNNKEELLKNLDELYNTYPDQLIGITAYDHSVTLFADELNFDEALERSNKLIEKYFNYSNSKEKNAWALLEQGMLYIDTKGKLSNNAQAQSSFTKILSDFSESEAAIILTELYDIEAPEKKKKEQMQNFSLLPPSPNPSNPSTTLKFILSEESKVSLVIYDIMGHEVWRLNNSTYNSYQAGYHSVVWNGTNNNGDPVSSGTYIVVMTTPEFRKTRKIIFLK